MNRAQDGGSQKNAKAKPSSAVAGPRHAICFSAVYQAREARRFSRRLVFAEEVLYALRNVFSCRGVVGASA